MKIRRIVALAAFGLIADIALAQLAKDMHLEDAGFVMRTAKSEVALKQATDVPARRFVARVKNGKRYYIYADPDTCKCVFLGDEAAMQNFRAMRARPAQPGSVPAAGDNMEELVVNSIDSDADMRIGEGHILDWTE
jgi:hypothetical protein